MPRGQYTRKTKLDLSESVALATTNQFSDLGWWSKLNQDEQNVIQSEGRLLAEEMVKYGKSRLAIGEHLTRLQGVLEPHNLFGRFLKQFHFSKRTAYRYITGYKNAKALLPETVLNVAIARGVNIVGDTEFKPLGVYTSAVAKLPVPKEATEAQAQTYLTQLEIVRKQDRTETPFTMPEPQDAGTLLKECYRFVSLRYKRLPNNSKVKANWVRSLVGMLLADLGVAGQQTFAPQAVPEDFRGLRGRQQIASA